MEGGGGGGGGGGGPLLESATAPYPTLSVVVAVRDVVAEAGGGGVS